MVVAVADRVMAERRGLAARVVAAQALLQVEQLVAQGLLIQVVAGAEVLAP